MIFRRGVAERCLVVPSSDEEGRRWGQGNSRSDPFRETRVIIVSDVPLRAKGLTGNFPVPNAGVVDQRREASLLISAKRSERKERANARFLDQPPRRVSLRLSRHPSSSEEGITHFSNHSATQT